jgi:hypothetical protein
MNPYGIFLALVYSITTCAATGQSESSLCSIFDRGLLLDKTAFIAREPCEENIYTLKVNTGTWDKVYYPQNDILNLKAILPIAKNKLFARSATDSYLKSNQDHAWVKLAATDKIILHCIRLVRC